MAADAEERAGVVGSQEDDVENERLLSNSGETRYALFLSLPFSFFSFFFFSFFLLGQ